MGSAYLFQEIFTMAGPLAEFYKVWTSTLARLWIFSILLLKNYGNFEVIPKRLSTLLPKMNVQPMQKKKWQCEVFYAVVDSVIARINERFLVANIF